MVSQANINKPLALCAVEVTVCEAVQPLHWGPVDPDGIVISQLVTLADILRGSQQKKCYSKENVSDFRTA